LEGQEAAMTNIKAMNRAKCIATVKNGVACFAIVSKWVRALHLLFE
jgi:hypothetical protein